MSSATHTLQTISKLLDISPRRVQQLVKEGVIPKTERGRYELVPAVRGYIHYLRDRNLNPNVISLDQVRTKKILAEAELAEIELHKQKGELISVEATRVIWQEIISSAKSKLLSMPAKLAPIVAVEEKALICKSIIEEQVFEALDELASYITEISVTESDSSELEPTAKTDS